MHSNNGLQKMKREKGKRRVSKDNQDKVTPEREELQPTNESLSNHAEHEIASSSAQVKDILPVNLPWTASSLADYEEIDPQIVQMIWARRAARLAEVPPEQEEGEQVILVVLRLGQELYAVDARQVFDMRPLEYLTPVPRVPEWVAGVVNLRGRILSVINLQRFLGLAHPEAAKGGGKTVPYLVAVESSDMEVILLADEIIAVETMPVNRIQDVARSIRGLHPEYVRGVATRGNGEEDLVVILNLESLLADRRLIIHEEVG